MSVTRNQYTLPPPHAYDLLRRQHPDLTLYAAIGARLYNQLPVWDTDGLTLLARVATTATALLDRFFASIQSSLAVDALVPLGMLRAAWRSLALAAVSRLAPASAAATLTITGAGAAMLDATNQALAADLTLSGQSWLARGTSILSALSEVAP